MRALHFPRSHSFPHKNLKSPCGTEREALLDEEAAENGAPARARSPQNLEALLVSERQRGCAVANETGRVHASERGDSEGINSWRAEKARLEAYYEQLMERCEQQEEEHFQSFLAERKKNEALCQRLAALESAVPPGMSHQAPAPASEQWMQETATPPDTSTAHSGSASSRAEAVAIDQSRVVAIAAAKDELARVRAAAREIEDALRAELREVQLQAEQEQRSLSTQLESSQREVEGLRAAVSGAEARLVETEQKAKQYVADELAAKQAGESTALSPLPLISSYKSEKSLCGQSWMPRMHLLAGPTQKRARRWLRRPWRTRSSGRR